LNEERDLEELKLRINEIVELMNAHENKLKELENLISQIDHGKKRASPLLNILALLSIYGFFLLITISIVGLIFSFKEIAGVSSQFAFISLAIGAFVLLMQAIAKRFAFVWKFLRGHKWEDLDRFE